MTVGVGETERTAEPEGALARPVLRRAVAAVVVVAWLAWAVPSWMSSLQQVRPHEFVADVQSGKVTGYQVVSNVRPDALGGLGSAWYADVPAADEMGRPTDGPPRDLIYTVDGGARTRWLAETPPMVGELDPFAAMSASGARPFTPETYPPNRDWAAFPALVAFALVAFAWVTLPPRRGTRPFWFLTGTLTAGVGFLAYAVAELWWRRAAPAVDEVGEAGEAAVSEGASGDGAERDQRLRWWHGLLVALIGGLLLSALVSVTT